jgi:hypothetical protein
MIYLFEWNTVILYYYIIFSLENVIFPLYTVLQSQENESQTNPFF